MADYFAVLQRTLAGFEAPQEHLRQKLYERARVTIKRQLDGRVPKADDATISAEMAKLEQAIVDIETHYGGGTPEPVSAEPDSELAPEPVPETLQMPQEVVEPAPEVEAPVQLIEEPSRPQEAVSPPAINSVEETIIEQAQPEPLAPEPPPIPVFEPEQTITEIPVEAPAEITAETLAEQDPIAAALADFTKADAERKAERLTTEVEQTVSMPVEAAANTAVEEALAALPDVGEEAIASEPDTVAAAATVAGDIAPPPVKDYTDPAAELALPQAPQLESVSSAQAEAVHPVPELQSIDFNDGQHEELAIPPAPGMGGGEPHKKKSRWVLLILLLLILLGGAAAAFFIFQDSVMEKFGSAEQNATTPATKVKTIKVTPQPEQEETTEPKAETSPPAPAPKTEARLNENGEEVSSSEPAPTESAVTQPATTDPVTEKPAAAGGDTRAFLYEEDAASGTSNVNNGSVSWSIVQESPGPGQPEEPAIRAQIEIPDRKTVLIMTLKRNTDPGLTASHIIDVIFAVPDDFSGGAIEEINRVVMKETEEGRGETLTAGSVKIQSGIFLIALDNLESAKKRNVELLRSRNWIDIPVRYRTGRRALVTIEKGSQGEKVFQDAFAAWDKSS